MAPERLGYYTGAGGGLIRERTDVALTAVRLKAARSDS